MVALAVLALAPGWGAGRALAREILPTDTIVIETTTRLYRVVVEVASTPEQRQQGLQGREHLAPDHGMLFDFGRPQLVIMWMKDTPVSLDMIFLDARGRVITIAERTKPGSLTEIPSGRPVRAVLEMVAGTAERLGLGVGDRVLHPIFTTN